MRKLKKCSVEKTKMKYWTKSLIVLITLLSVIALISCSEPDASDSLGTIRIPVPVFGESVVRSSGNRGVISMPIEKFDNNFGLATAVMTTMPAMTSISPVDINVNKDDFGIDLVYSVYGFKIKLQTGSSTINQDGVYLRYDIYSSIDSDTVVGVADYYYSFVEKKFSYRQIVSVTFKEPHVNQLIVIEYNGIELQNPVVDSGFSAGQLTTEGVLNDDVIVDNIRLGDTLNEDEGNCGLIRRNVTMRAKDGIVAAFCQPDTEQVSVKVPWKDLPQDLQAVMQVIDTNNNYMIDTDAERSVTNKDFALGLVKHIYAHGASIVARDNGTPYRTYAEYQADSIKDLNSEINAFSTLESHVQVISSPMPSIYRVSDGMGASTHKGAKMSVNFLFINSVERYKTAGFNEFCPIEDDTPTGDDVGLFLIEQQLRTCGITNSNYIEAFKTATLDAERNGFIYPDRIQISNATTK